ncbi:MAG: ribosomal protein S18-alanine N-acetyltransferase [Pseudomonadales bacterium]|nr:ribosomal protein S18-alanine N-acetyltransferase [Pseudomonadales bacterium]MCB1664809.1 ribosomal protein S18-alanine N-acetyltransferase [Pseudomonadales bacterium]
MLQAATADSSNVFMRAMRASDLDLVVQSENLSLQNPWTKRVFADCLRSGYECWVLASRDRLVAHGVLSVGAGEAHVLTLCVHPQYRGKGYGRRMLRHLLEKGYRKGGEIAFLEVRPSNKTAISLYLATGFVQVGERRGYYPAEPGETHREDALILSRALPL